MRHDDHDYLSRELEDREVAVAQAVEFAEYVEQHAKGSMVERARHFLSTPYANELRRRLRELAAYKQAVREISAQIGDRLPGVLEFDVQERVAELMSVSGDTSHAPG